MFLKDDSYLDSSNSIEKKTLRKLACCFFLNGETSKKEHMAGILLRCVDTPEANRIIARSMKASVDPT